MNLTAECACGFVVLATSDAALGIGYLEHQRWAHPLVNAACSACGCGAVMLGQCSCFCHAELHEPGYGV